jgi:hypothetical protein
MMTPVLVTADLLRTFEDVYCPRSRWWQCHWQSDDVLVTDSRRGEVDPCDEMPKDTVSSLRLMHMIYDIHELDVMVLRRFKLNESAESMMHDV